MRHNKARHQLNRFTSWRKATLISLAKAVITHQEIQTTLARAKAARPLVEQLIGLGKANSLAAKRKAYAILSEHRLVTLLFKDIAPRFSSRTGGYTRILNLNFRRGDNAALVLFGLSEIKKEEPRPVKSETSAEKKVQKPQEKPVAGPEQAKEEKTKPEAAPKAKPADKKPTKKFLGGLRGIFKKERDSL